MVPLSVMSSFATSSCHIIFITNMRARTRNEPLPLHTGYLRGLALLEDIMEKY